MTEGHKHSRKTTFPRPGVAAAPPSPEQGPASGAEARARRSLRSLPRRAERGKVRAGTGSPDPWPVRPGPPPAQPGPLAQRAPRRRLPTPGRCSPWWPWRCRRGLRCRSALPRSLPPSLLAAAARSVARSVRPARRRRWAAQAAPPQRPRPPPPPGGRCAAQQPSAGAGQAGADAAAMLPPRPPFPPFGSAPGAAAGLSARSLSVRAGGGKHPLRCDDPRGSRPGRSRGRWGRTDLAHRPCPQGLCSVVRVWPQILAGVGQRALRKALCAPWVPLKGNFKATIQQGKEFFPRLGSIHGQVVPDLFWPGLGVQQL